MEDKNECYALSEESSSSRVTNGKEVRGNWSGQLDFLLSCIGYAVGIGNIWRFPYLCYKNGGGAFLIPYLIFMAIGALPMFFLEYSISQFSSSGSITVWKICPLLKGVGYTTVIASTIFLIYFNIFMTWVLYFLYQSFTSVLPWSHCSNNWNTDQCYDASRNGTLQNISTVNTTKLTASEEYWRYNVLEITKGLEDIGGIRLELLLCVFISWLILFLCVCKGIKTSGKIVYVTVTFPYIVLVIFLVRAVTLPGAMEGIKFFIIPKWHKMLSTQVWGEAALQIFFSSGIGWGSILTFASFNKFNHNMYRDAMVVPVINSATSIFAGFVTFSVLGFMAQEKGMTVDDVVTQGPGLAFVAYPEAIAKLPISQLWAVLFFLMMLTVAIDTQFGTLETIVTALTDEYQYILGNKKTLVTAVICCLGFVLDIPFIMQGGMYVLQIVDWYCGLFSAMIVSSLECITIGWLYGTNSPCQSVYRAAVREGATCSNGGYVLNTVREGGCVYGTDRFYRDIEMMLGYQPSKWWSICWKFITPGLILMMLIFNMSQLTPVSYGTYQYPLWAKGLGWIIGLVSIVPIPLYIIYSLCQEDNVSILEKLGNLVKPSPEWGPVQPIYKDTTTRTIDNKKAEEETQMFL